MINTSIKKILYQTIIILQGKRSISSKCIIKKNISLEPCKKIKYGDYFSSIIFILKKKNIFRELNDSRLIIKSLFDKLAFIKNINTGYLGFFNIILTNKLLSLSLIKILKNKKHKIFKKKNILLEFVSANPTGPLHIGHARGVYIGEISSRLLLGIGHNVIKDYYINDYGNQILDLGLSIYNRYCQLFGKQKQKHKGYPGLYIIEIAKLLKSKYGHSLLNKKHSFVLSLCTNFGIKENLNNIKNDLAFSGIFFNKWTSERLFHIDNFILCFLKDIFRYKHLYYKDNSSRGAFFSFEKIFKSEDRILLKSNGEAVYLMSDMFYHKKKMTIGFDYLLNVVGADHSTHIKYIKYSQYYYKRDIIIKYLNVQIVKLIKEGRELKLSKRNGDVYSLIDLINDVGLDSVRFYFLMRDFNSSLDFNINMAKLQNTKNPVYYVQYAYARLCNLLTKINLKNYCFEININLLLTLSLTHERNIIKKINEFYYYIYKISNSLESHKLIYYCIDIVKEFHSYFSQYKNINKIISSDIKKTRARIELINAIKITLKNILNILKIYAPTYMDTQVNIKK